MKALTLTQPWATLVAIGAKRIETRSWSTDYRGPLAIHAAKGFPAGARHMFYLWPFRPILKTTIYQSPSDLPLGAVIATCELVGVDRFEQFLHERKPMLWGKGPHLFELTAEEKALGDYTIGHYGWFLANVKMLPEPIPVKGSLGLWEWKQP